MNGAGYDWGQALRATGNIRSNANKRPSRQVLAERWASVVTL